MNNFLGFVEQFPIHVAVYQLEYKAMLKIIILGFGRNPLLYWHYKDCFCLTSPTILPCLVNEVENSKNILLHC